MPMSTTKKSTLTSVMNALKIASIVWEDASTVSDCKSRQIVLTLLIILVDRKGNFHGTCEFTFGESDSGRRLGSFLVIPLCTGQTTTMTTPAPTMTTPAPTPTQAVTPQPTPQSVTPQPTPPRSVTPVVTNPVDKRCVVVGRRFVLTSMLCCLIRRHLLRSPPRPQVN